MKFLMLRNPGFKIICIFGIILFFIQVMNLRAQSALTESEIAKAQKYLEKNLIAPCCFRQPLADHDSDAAEEMKKEIAGLLRSGKSVEQIENYYIKKYGDRILAVPRMKGFNMMSFLMPIFIFTLGVVIILLTLKRWISKQNSQTTSVHNRNVSDSMDDRIESELKDY